MVVAMSDIGRRSGHSSINTHEPRHANGELVSSINTAWEVAVWGRGRRGEKVAVPSKQSYCMFRTYSRSERAEKEMGGRKMVDAVGWWTAAYVVVGAGGTRRLDGGYHGTLGRCPRCRHRAWMRL